MRFVKLPMVLEDACPDKDLQTPTTDIWLNPEHVVSVEEDWHDRAVLSMDRSDARASITVALPAAEVVELLAREVSPSMYYAVRDQVKRLTKLLEQCQVDEDLIKRVLAGEEP